MKIAIVGDGRMARAIQAEAADAGDEVTAVIGLAGNADAKGITQERLAGAEVVLEFTTPASVVANLHALRQLGATVVCGTTGWEAQRAAVEGEWRDAPGALLAANNFALGMYLFFRAAAALATAAVSRPEFDGFIHERHHAAKLDAPSGTAIKLRSVVTNADPGREWPITSVRAGRIPGEHELVLDGIFETITLRHVARDRRVFASGALAAARWVRGRRGVFTLDAMFAGH